MLSKWTIMTCLLSLLLLTTSCGDSSSSSIEDAINPDSEAVWHKIEYVDVRPTSDFQLPGWGIHLYYFPGFDLANPADRMPTDHESAIERTPDFADFTHYSDIVRKNKKAKFKELNAEELLPRTFSLDDDTKPRGVKTAGGYDWPYFRLPNGRYGKSGVAYDPHTYNKKENKGNSNNIINKMRVNTKSLHAFCLNIVADNTNGMFDPAQITAQSDSLTEDKKIDVLHSDGIPDVYTFAYRGIQENDVVKIKINGSDANPQGSGLGGILVSHIDTCCKGMCETENECGGDNGCGSPCDCTNGEVQVNLRTNNLSEANGAQAYYIRGLYTRQVLTVGANGSDIEMRPRLNTLDQQWVFVGNCDSKNQCEGMFVNRLTKGCLQPKKNGDLSTAYSGSCSGDSSKWEVAVLEGGDRVTGDQTFPDPEVESEYEKYSIRHEPSKNNYLYAMLTKTQAKERSWGAHVSVNSRKKPNKPWDQWVFESAHPNDRVIEF